mgnify:FL=1
MQKRTSKKVPPEWKIVNGELVVTKKGQATLRAAKNPVKTEDT